MGGKSKSESTWLGKLLRRIIGPPFRIKDFPNPNDMTGVGAGKVCVASRDLKAGSVLLNEPPLFQIPSQQVHESCITCGKKLPLFTMRSPSNSCSHCNWPVCGEECAKLSIHATNECHVFTANEIPYTYPNEQKDIAWYPMWMRCYAIMNQQPELWKIVAEMAKDYLKDKSKEEWISRIPISAEKTRGVFPLLPDDEDWSLMKEAFKNIHTMCIHHGYRIVSTNQTATISLQKSTKKQLDGSCDWNSYIYTKTIYFTHACSPNCDWIIGGYPDFRIIIRTAVPVKKGKILTLSRFANNLHASLGTLKRQTLFCQYYKDLELRCKCKLCMDPTEFGSFQSAVVCALCKEVVEKVRREWRENDEINNNNCSASCSSSSSSDIWSDSEVTQMSEREPELPMGYLLPVDPLDFKEDALWKCNKCTEGTPASAFTAQVNKIGDDLLYKLNDRIWLQALGVKSAKEYYDTTMEKNKDKLLHPNHWILQVATQLLRKGLLMTQFGSMNERVIASESEEEDDEQDNLLEKLTMDVLESQFLTKTWNLRHRALHLSCVGTRMLRRLFCTPVELRKKSGDELVDLRHGVLQCSEIVKEALDYFKIDSSAIDQEYHASMKLDQKTLRLFLKAIVKGIERLELKMAAERLELEEHQERVEF